MLPVRLPVFWLPHSLRQQFLLAVTALTLLILAGGGTAVYALRTSAATIRLLAEERLVRMQTAQDLVRRTLWIEHESFQLTDAETLVGMQDSYEQILKQLTEFGGLVDRLAVDNGSQALLDLHRSSQLFRNTVNVVAQLRERELRAKEDGEASGIGPAGQRYLSELHRQAEALMIAAQFQSERFTRLYREDLTQLDELAWRNMYWVALLVAASLLLAWAVAQWFLGRHVLGRLLEVSRNLRLGDESEAGHESSADHQSGDAVSDEIDAMAQAVGLLQEDRRALGQRTEQLRLARDAAEAANKAKSAFLANMSHELRTPLNAILGFSTMLRQNPGFSDEQRESLEIIIHSGEHLLKLINDVLEIAKIEAGKLQLDISSFDLQGMIREVTDMMRVRAQQKGLRLELDQSSIFPRYIKGDEARLRQILVNLIGNAVKFTDQGGVTLRLGAKQNHQRHLLMEVEDSGPGIPSDEQRRLFKPFVQLSEGAVHGGTGLGLSIVRQFAELMGGGVTVESTLGKGSLFRVELPLEAADEAEILRSQDQMVRGEVVALAPGQPDYRILIAEDQRENQLLLARLMSEVGLETRIANNGEECVRLFEAWKPDLIWMDWRMPIMDGAEATRRIRDMPGGSQVKIVAVTASVFKEQQPELLAAGMDDYVRKPYRFHEIYDSMARQLGLKFVCRTEEPEVEHEALVLTPEQLATIAADKRDELRAAVESLDPERIIAATGQIDTIDAEVGRLLFRLVDQFDYPTILKLLDRASTSASPNAT